MITVKRFTASWCAPCKILAPILSELATQYPTVMFETLDVDEHSEAAKQHNIRSVPTVLFFKNQDLIGVVIGAHVKQKYVDEIEKAITPKNEDHLHE